MKHALPTSTIARLMAGLVVILLVLLPFHAFLTVWGASLVGHYTLLRLWKEVGLALLVIGTVVLTVMTGRRDGMRHLHDSLRPRLLLIAITAYCLLLFIGGLVSYAAGSVTPKALAYGLLLDTRFLVFFVVVWQVSRYDRRIIENWRRIVLVPAGLVIVFGLLQFLVLPADFLTHFGYGPSTIDAVQTVDQKAGYQRIQSTLRGANPLGAYLVIIIAATITMILRHRPHRSWQTGLLLAGASLALGMTFSRSAWLGALVAGAVLLLMAIRSPQIRRRLIVGTAAAVVALAGLGYGLRTNDVVQNTLLHTDEHSRAATSSNTGHLTAIRAATHDIVQQPLGRGVGTAGPASVYNEPRLPRIAEDYYLQVGQEVGLIGVILFAAINVLLGRELLRRRDHPLARMLLASLAGISVVCLLSHAWTDDTLAYIWWGLAGTAMILPVSGCAASLDKQDIRAQRADRRMTPDEKS